MDVRVVDTIPIDDLLGLYGSCGWAAYTADPAGLARAVAESDYVVTVRREGRLIGLARCLSDDVAVVYLQDILVRPDHQGSGVGRALMEACLRRYEHVRTRLLLTDDEERQHAFYRAMGYREIDEVDGGLHAFVRFRRD